MSKTAWTKDEKKILSTKKSSLKNVEMRCYKAEDASKASQKFRDFNENLFVTGYSKVMRDFNIAFLCKAKENSDKNKSVFEVYKVADSCYDFWIYESLKQAMISKGFSVVGTANKTKGCTGKITVHSFEECVKMIDTLFSVYKSDILKIKTRTKTKASATA